MMQSELAKLQAVTCKSSGGQWSQLAGCLMAAADAFSDIGRHVRGQVDPWRAISSFTALGASGYQDTKDTTMLDFGRYLPSTLGTPR